MTHADGRNYKNRNNPSINGSGNATSIVSTVAPMEQHTSEPSSIQEQKCWEVLMQPFSMSALWDPLAGALGGSQSKKRGTPLLPSQGS